MRLIGSVDNEKQAFVFYSFLAQAGIHSTYEPYFNPESKKEEIHIWVYEEEAVEQAMGWLEEFKADPKDPRFAEIQLPFTPPQPPDLIAEQRRETEDRRPPPKWQGAKRATHSAVSSFPVTLLVIITCFFLFLVDTAEELSLLQSDGTFGLEVGRTALQRSLFFDYTPRQEKIDQLLQEFPLKSAESLSTLPPEAARQFEEASTLPSWPGAMPLLLDKIRGKPPSPDQEAPLFIKIRQGEVWRLFTPCLLHGGLLHILFNMAWAWLLLKQLEARLPRLKILLFILVTAIISNVAQYLMTGPVFLGFSGVVVALVGFIWMRQKLAPWEGYPLHSSTVLFVLVFIGGMVAVDLVVTLLNLVGLIQTPFQIANTAHVVGGLSGLALGRLPFFARRMQ